MSQSYVLSTYAGSTIKIDAVHSIGAFLDMEKLGVPERCLLVLLLDLEDGGSILL
jgi:hypothetical protein